MRLHPRIPRLPRPRSIAALALSVGVGGVASLALVTAASAHASLISGSAQCQSNGTYTVSWTISNDWTLADTITEVSHTGGGTFSGLPTTIPASAAKTPPYKSVTVLQTGVSGSATSASLTVHGTWTDKVTETNSGSVTLPGTCTSNTAATAPDLHQRDAARQRPVATRFRRRRWRTTSSRSATAHLSPLQPARSARPSAR